MVTIFLALSLPFHYCLNKLKGVLSLKSAHDTHTVQEMDGLNIIMWWSCFSCVWANLWISLVTTYTSRSLWKSLYLTKWIWKESYMSNWCNILQLSGLCECSTHWFCNRSSGKVSIAVQCVWTELKTDVKEEEETTSRARQMHVSSSWVQIVLWHIKFICIEVFKNRTIRSIVIMK
jgi:hypothetical protein